MQALSDVMPGRLHESYFRFMNKQRKIEAQLPGNSEVDELFIQREEPCVSVLVNLFNVSNMLAQNVNHVKKGIDRAIDAIDDLNISDEEKAHLIANLDAQGFSFKNTGKSMAIGIFVSPTIACTIHFPFPVNECSIVGTTFEVRDLLYLEQYLEPYYAVNITKHALHFYRGRANSLEEIRNGNFPKKHSEDTVDHATAHHLAAFLNDSHSHLVVSGPAALVNEIEHIYPYKDNLSRISHAFNDNAVEEFAESAWTCVSDARKQSIIEAIKRVDDLPLNHKAEGLREVWTAASEGRGLLLLVERDYQRAAYRLKANNAIRLHAPQEDHERIEDAVDDVIEIVRMKHGRIIFTEPGQLKRYEGIVLTLRY